MNTQSQLTTAISLLEKVNLIVKKHEEIEKLSGAKFNVFSTLGLSSDELAHSRFISNLLNPYGSHGQGDRFLKLFTDYLKEKFILNCDDNIEEESNINLLNYFNTEKARTYNEFHIGKVNYLNNEGGRIDILISSESKNIIIENKVYAGDQHKQIKRYYEYDKHAPIFYLTLNENKTPSKSSSQDLKLNHHFFSISYQVDICEWIEACIKESATLPIIRETLRQYQYLIKNLTNQSSNKIMSKEIIDILRKNKENYLAAREIAKSYSELIPLFFDEIIKFLEEKFGNTFFVNRAISNREKTKDGLFISICEKTMNNKTYHIGLNIELWNNNCFFCAIEKGKVRRPINNQPVFSEIKENLKSINFSFKSQNKSNGWYLFGAFIFQDDTKQSFAPEYYSLSDEEQHQYKNRIFDFINILIEESSLR